MTNHEVALVWMATVLTRLGEAWPSRTSLILQETVVATGAVPIIPKEKLWSDLWLWLVEEGLVRIKPEHTKELSGVRITVEQRIDMAVLTAKGLDALRNMARPKSDEVDLDSVSDESGIASNRGSNR
jgi:hypothetical protein